MWETTVSSWHKKQFMQTLYTTCTLDDIIAIYKVSVL